MGYNAAVVTIPICSDEPRHLVFGQTYTVVDHDRGILICTRPANPIFGRRTLETTWYRLAPKQNALET